MDEKSALCALKKGDEAALCWFLERYTGYVATIVNNVMLPRLSPADAEEVVSDVFLALWRGCRQLKGENGRAWLAGTARNKARDALRAARLELPLEDDLLSLAGPGPDESLTERELHERTRRAVAEMGEPDREIFLRHYFYCQCVADIALALDMNVNTVKTRLRRGRERLKTELTKGDA